MTIVPSSFDIGSSLCTLLLEVWSLGCPRGTWMSNFTSQCSTQLGKTFYLRSATLLMAPYRCLLIPSIHRSRENPFQRFWTSTSTTRLGQISTFTYYPIADAKFSGWAHLAWRAAWNHLERCTKQNQLSSVCSSYHAAVCFAWRGFLQQIHQDWYCYSSPLPFSLYGCNPLPHV